MASAAAAAGRHCRAPACRHHRGTWSQGQPRCQVLRPFPLQTIAVGTNMLRCIQLEQSNLTSYHCVNSGQVCQARIDVCLKLCMAATGYAPTSSKDSYVCASGHLDNLPGVAQLIQQQRVLWHAVWLPLLLRPGGLHSAILQSCSRGRRPLHCPKQQQWQQRLL